MRTMKKNDFVKYVNTLWNGYVKNCERFELTPMKKEEFFDLYRLKV